MINASQTRTGHSVESTRGQVKDTKSQNKVFMLFNVVNDIIFFEQVSNASPTLPPLQNFHDELKGIE